MNDAGPEHVEEAIDTIAELERRHEAASTAPQRWIERATANLGKPRTFMVIIAFVILWAGINMVLQATGARAFDPPPFSYLQGIVTLCALLMTSLILTTTTRAAQVDAQRDRLSLQMALINERRAAKLVAMVDELRLDDPRLPDRHDPEVEQLKERTDTHAVVRAIEERTPNAPGTPETPG